MAQWIPIDVRINLVMPDYTVLDWLSMELPSREAYTLIDSMHEWAITNRLPRVSRTCTSVTYRLDGRLTTIYLDLDSESTYVPIA